MAFRERRHVGAVFFDLEGAYDTTWRYDILLKVFNCGIRFALGCFIRNFLSERFCVCVGSQFSDRFLQENGVPQGGVLSVALFALAINDIGSVLPQSIGRPLFADDFAIWCSSPSTPTLERQLQLAVTRLERWCTVYMVSASSQRKRRRCICVVAAEAVRAFLSACTEWRFLWNRGDSFGIVRSLPGSSA